MPELDVPCATNSPNTCNDVPLLNVTSTPASTVNFTPSLTNTDPVTTYGLPDALHVVSEDTCPFTAVPELEDPKAFRVAVDEPEPAL
jgi:hypothetical protein